MSRGFAGVTVAVVTVGLVTFIPMKEKFSAAAFAGGSLLLVLVAGRKVRHGVVTPAA